MEWSLPRPIRRSAGFILRCLPTPSRRPRTGPEWVHEIKYDGYRVIVRRDGDRVRGYDWAKRYPLIVEAGLSLRVRSGIIEKASYPSGGISPIVPVAGEKPGQDQEPRQPGDAADAGRWVVRRNTGQAPVDGTVGRGN